MNTPAGQVWRGTPYLDFGLGWVPLVKNRLLERYEVDQVIAGGIVLDTILQ